MRLRVLAITPNIFIIQEKIFFGLFWAQYEPWKFGDEVHAIETARDILEKHKFGKQVIWESNGD